MSANFMSFLLHTYQMLPNLYKRFCEKVHAKHVRGICYVRRGIFENLTFLSV